MQPQLARRPRLRLRMLQVWGVGLHKNVDALLSAVWHTYTRFLNNYT